MSTALLERVEASTSWGPWIVGNNGVGDRRYFVLRYEDDSDHRSRAEYHTNARGDAIKYTLAGAEKKARELNREDAKAAQSAAYFAKVEAERLEVQTLAQEIREVAQCGTQNSEMIARWIIGNYTGNGEVEDVRDIHIEALLAAQQERDEVIEELNCAIDIATRADTAIQAMAAAAVALEQPNATEFAYGSTDAERALDVLSDGLWAIAEYQENLSSSDLPEKREIK